MADWLTTEEAAAYLKVHPKTLYRYVKAGKLRQYNPGGRGHPRFLQEELDGLLRQPTVEGAITGGDPVEAGRVLVSPGRTEGEGDERLEERGRVESGEPSGSGRQRRRGFAFGSGFPLAPVEVAGTRRRVLREIVMQVEELSRRCEELRQAVEGLLASEQEDGGE